MSTFTLTPGATPLLVSMPHTATGLPPDLAARMTEAGRTLPDTDWHIHQLYDFAGDLGAGVIRPEYSRYVIDLNRAPDGRALYKGVNNTELCPTSTFAEEPIWQPGEEPREEEVIERRARYWLPYHEALAAEGVHAVQLELAQIAYMDEDPPFAYRPEKAARLQPVLKALLETMLDWAQVQPDSRP